MRLSLYEMMAPHGASAHATWAPATSRVRREERSRSLHVGSRACFTLGVLPEAPLAASRPNTWRDGQDEVGSPSAPTENDPGAGPVAAPPCGARWRLLLTRRRGKSGVLGRPDPKAEAAPRLSGSARLGPLPAVGAAGRGARLCCLVSNAQARGRRVRRRKGSGGSACAVRGRGAILPGACPGSWPGGGQAEASGSWGSGDRGPYGEPAMYWCPRVCRGTWSGGRGADSTPIDGDPAELPGHAAAIAGPGPPGPEQPPGSLGPGPPRRLRGVVAPAAEDILEGASCGAWRLPRRKGSSACGCARVRP